jgi:hypothetical protein
MNKYYVYVFLDPTRPGDYIYGDFKFNHEPFYIGKGCDNRIISTRIIDRCSGFKKSKLINLKKSGFDPLVKILVDNLTNEESKQVEIDLILRIGRRDLGIGPLTNLTNGGDGRTCGSNNTKSIEKQRQSLINTNKIKRENGIIFSVKEETKEKLRKINQGESNPMFGKTHTEEVREAHSLRVSGMNHPMFGRNHGEKTIEKIKENRNKSVNQEEFNKRSSEFNSKSIIQLSLDGLFICEYSSIKEASEKTGLSESLIGKTCRGKIKNPRKFIFKFKKEEDMILRNSFLIKIGDMMDGLKLIKRNKKTVIVEDNGIFKTIRQKEHPIFWDKKVID